MTHNAPYPGLRPYHEDEQGKFFGRDVDAEILLDKVLTNRLTLLFAASGVGKSSLLQAAIIPRLKSPTGENLEVVYHIDWVSEPVSSVRAAVLQALHASGKLPEGAADETGQTLAELLEFCGLFVRHPLVLILDQFEEFFRYQRATTSFQPFIEQLTAVITNPQLPVSLVLSMREDFALELNALKSSLPTFLFDNFFRLERMNLLKAKDAIELPIKELGYTYEEDLLNKLISDLSNQYLISKPSVNNILFGDTIELPYLQIVCSHLWKTKNSNRKTISHEDYSAAGNAHGILHNHINISLSKLTPTEKYITDRIFSCLVNYPGFKVAYTIEGLSKTINVEHNELANILNKLEKTQIIRKNNNKNENWHELSHDMYSQIIREWQYAWRDTPEWDISLPELRRRKIITQKHKTSKVDLIKKIIKEKSQIWLKIIQDFLKRNPSKNQYKTHSSTKYQKPQSPYQSPTEKAPPKSSSIENEIYIVISLIIIVMCVTIIWIVITQNH